MQHTYFKCIENRLCSSINTALLFYEFINIYVQKYLLNISTWVYDFFLIKNFLLQSFFHKFIEQLVNVVMCSVEPR